MNITNRIMGALKRRIKKHVERAVVVAIVFFDIRILGKQLASTVPDYYTPIPDTADFSADFWDKEIPMLGVELNETEALSFAQQFLPSYFEEFRGLFPIEKPSSSYPGFYVLNGTYMVVDAHMLYGMIRYAKPRRMIEIGSGASTVVTQAAVQKNAQEDHSYRCAIYAIDPFPSPWLQQTDPSVLTVMTMKVQDVPLAFFDALEAGDILFIDSTHVVREGNDVLREYLEILPRLKPGVFVHVHDISLPKRYPKTYFDQNIYWTEQYLLQAYLTYNQRVRVLWPGNAMLLHHAHAMLALFPEIQDMRQKYPSAEASAFWFVTT
jgi:hypothetical protein